ncbi:MAG TPA: hypothetical protein VE956_14630 [Nodularia sp. (in: cyanobacteria)]|nr:hypothetical protein [Nodularia sp. (in: cyanobacteria)]
MFSTNHINADMALGLISTQLPNNSCPCGISLTSLKLPEKSLPLGIIRDHQIILARTKPTISSEDYILDVALNTASDPMLKVVLNKRHPVHYSSPQCLINNSKTTYRELF